MAHLVIIQDEIDQVSSQGSGRVSTSSSLQNSNGSRGSSDALFEMLGRDKKLEKLTARVTALERKYDNLGRKTNPSWEEMTDLYDELKKKCKYNLKGLSMKTNSKMASPELNRRS